MRMVLNCTGSTGDIFQYIALGEQLQQLGHSVVLALEPNWETVVQRFGLEFYPIGPRLSREFVYDLLLKMTSEVDVSKQWEEFLSRLSFAVPSMLEDLTRVCKNSDALIGSCYTGVPQMVHDSTGLPFVSVRPSNYGEKDDALRTVAATYINRSRRLLGFREVPDPFSADGNSRLLSLYACSPGLTKSVDDRTMGFFFMEKSAFEPIPDLAEFVDSSDRPILVTFGSMVLGDPARITNLIIDAVRPTGRRLIIQQGWSGLGAGVVDLSWVRVIGNVSYDWLFPRVSCVIHHGGAGTLAACLRAGTPSIVVPCFFDQYFWAEHAISYGASPGLIPARDLSIEKLTTSLQMLFDDLPQYRERCAAAATMIAGEPGVRGAARRISAVLGSPLKYEAAVSSH